MGAGEDERVHSAGHAHVAETALFFKFLGVVEGARVGEKTLFKAGKKDEGKFQTLGGVEGHEGDARFGVELVRIGSQSRVVEEFGQGFAAGFGVVRGVGQLLEVFNAAESFRGAFGFKSLDVAGAVNDETNQLGQCGGVAWSAKGGPAPLLVCRDFCRVRFKIGIGRGWIPRSLRRGRRGRGHPFFCLFGHCEKRSLGLGNKGRIAACVEELELRVVAAAAEIEAGS